MRRIAALSSMVILLALAAISHGFDTQAHPRGYTTAVSGFVGTWRVTVSDPNGNQFPVLSTYMADGTTIHHDPASQPAAPGASGGGGAAHSVVLATTGHGAWEAIGEDTSQMTFEVLNSDEKGNLIGRTTVSGIQTLDPGGDSYTGRFVVTITDPSGKVIAEIPTTATAERLKIQIPNSLSDS